MPPSLHARPQAREPVPDARPMADMPDDEASRRVSQTAQAVPAVPTNPAVLPASRGPAPPTASPTAARARGARQDSSTVMEAVRPADAPNVAVASQPRAEPAITAGASANPSDVRPAPIPPARACAAAGSRPSASVTPTPLSAPIVSTTKPSVATAPVAVPKAPAIHKSGVTATRFQPALARPDSLQAPPASAAAAGETPLTRPTNAARNPQARLPTAGGNGSAPPRVSRGPVGGVCTSGREANTSVDIASRASARVPAVMPTGLPAVVRPPTLPLANLPAIQPIHKQDVMSVPRAAAATPRAVNTVKPLTRSGSVPCTPGITSTPATPRVNSDGGTFFAEFRVYPFPPPTQPLMTPLPMCERHLPSRQACRALGRKRLLQRWEDERRNEMRLHKRPTAQRTGKRSRSPLRSCDDDDDSTKDGIVEAGRRRQALSDRDLPTGCKQNAHDGFNEAIAMTQSSRDAMTRAEKRARVSCAGRVDFCKLLDDGNYADGRDAIRSQGSHVANGTLNNMGDGVTRHGVNNNLLQNGGDHLTDTTPTCGVGNDGSVDRRYDDEGNNQATVLYDRVKRLRSQRAEVEEAEMEEIVRMASTRPGFENSTNGLDQLKGEIEGLCNRSVRDIVRLISRCVHGLHGLPCIEVKVQLDGLPLEVIRQLQVVVEREKGVAVVENSVKLELIRSQLRLAASEYRRVVGHPWREPDSF